MRLGVVRGHVVLSSCVSALRGTRLLVVEPITARDLADNGPGGGKPLIVADHLAPHEGQRVAFVEGREAANPYWPEDAPVDAYCALIADGVDFRPPSAETTLPGTGERR
ncbi:MAG: EutN/CcmL family microcompartment protein [Vicinamibacteria bacterium]|nr:EutN/CcmL family microcompartment protein [Vicinamibacteria bacterium]